MYRFKLYTSSNLKWLKDKIDEYAVFHWSVITKVNMYPKLEAIYKTRNMTRS